ncbi:uncharacterized protein LOC108915753 [Anoplophora glabripennis]|uniref:uncharacterized protein LOC108915753 n=1 Tax=Anoplophora glabripennis TaxID=217634 RepID=UPI00087481D2|nr:uncharacterized protein LOC108915753 [Anoplophora glabripennis]XP_018577391.1 uncharacterized protein LOC108915753 [Anoplophora glabripennis]
MSFLWRQLNKDYRIIYRLPKISLESYDKYFRSFCITKATMPPKRKAATTKVEAVADVDLGLDPPASKTRRGQAEDKAKKAEKRPVPSKGNKEKEKNLPEEKKVGRVKKTTATAKDETTAKSEKFVDKSNDIDSNITKRRIKKEDNSNGIAKEKVTQKKKENPPTEGAKNKRTKKDSEDKVEKSASSNSTVTKWNQIDFACTKKNGEGQKPNLKISCWNIGGLKSWVKKDCLKYLEYEDPDILCVQETKCSEMKLPEEIKKFEDYKQYWCASNKEGYAGVGLLTKTEPIQVFYGINVPELDEDGRCITAEYDEFYIISVYVPNAGRKLITLPKRLQWNTAFKDYVKSLDDKKPVVICGDMNVAHNEIDIARPASNTKNAGFTKEEREGMTDFLQDGYVDTFRKLYPDKTDVYTFWTYMANARAKNVGWRLDYFIVSERIMDKVCDIVMRSEVMGSDHCPITLFMNI